MTLVVDASVALKWVLDEPGSEAADAILDAEPVIVAPALWLSETANALWRRVLRGEIEAPEARERFARLRATPIRLTPIERNIEAALGLACELRHAVYDCLYLAVALAEDADVVTADRRFADAAARRSDLAPRVRLLGAD